MGERRGIERERAIGIDCQRCIRVPDCFVGLFGKTPQ
jgi:hypothetical protein